MRWWILLAIVAVIGLLNHTQPEPLAAASDELTYPGYQLTPLEAFAIEARVLGREDYWLGRESEVSPTDLVLGWGPMASDAVLQEISIDQRNRWYHWRSNDLPIPKRSIETHSANVHIIPRTEAVKQQLREVSRDDRLRLSGTLVEVRAADGWRWRSSLTREDTGKGSCEVLWLERIERLSGA